MAKFEGIKKIVNTCKIDVKAFNWSANSIFVLFLFSADVFPLIVPLSFEPPTSVEPCERFPTTSVSFLETKGDIGDDCCGDGCGDCWCCGAVLRGLATSTTRRGLVAFRRCVFLAKVAKQFVAGSFAV